MRLGRRRCHRGPAHADLDEVPAKEPGAVNGVVVATASFGARTAADAQVLAERRQIDVVRTCALLGHDMADMSGRPQISDCRGGAIALPFERRGETVEVRSAWPAPQMSQHPRCREVVSNMFVPVCDRPSVANPMGPRERTLWRQGEPQFTEKYRHRYANSPLLDLPIMQEL